ncbi:MAG: hypothetical protein ACJAU1_001204, partial [Psychromonas sp.]
MGVVNYIVYADLYNLSLVFTLCSAQLLYALGGSSFKIFTKNAPRTLHQTAKTCFDSSSSIEDTELKEEKTKQTIISLIAYVLVITPC